MNGVTDLDLRFASLEILAHGCAVHAIVELVASVRVKLKVGAHWGLNVAIKAFLQQISNVLAASVHAELLVELLVLWVIQPFNCLLCLSSGLSLTSFSTVNRKRERCKFECGLIVD